MPRNCWCDFFQAMKICILRPIYFDGIIVLMPALVGLIFLRKYKTVYVFSTISKPCDYTGSWNPSSSWKTRVHVSYRANTMEADVSAILGTSTSVVILLVYFQSNIQVTHGIHAKNVCRSSLQNSLKAKWFCCSGIGWQRAHSGLPLFQNVHLHNFCSSSICLYRTKKKTLLKPTFATGSFTCLSRRAMAHGDFRHCDREKLWHFTD